MNKYSMITLIAIIIIAIPVLYGLWVIYAVEQIQLGTEKTEFSFFEMASYEKIEMCNPLPFFVSFNELRIETYFTGDLKGVFNIGPTTLGPNSLQVLDADFSSESFSEAQYLFMHMDGQFDGELPIRLDPNQMEIITIFETKIIGIIPYHNTITQSGFDFTQMMNEDFRC